MLKLRWETEFKETEIGEIPQEWEMKRIEEISEIGGGTTPSTKIRDFWDGDVPWITPKDLSSWEYRFIQCGERNITQKAVKDNSLRIFPPGTVLLTSRAPIGYVAIAKNPITTNQGFKNIIPQNNTSSEFFYYILKHYSEYLKDISGGSTFGELTKEILRNVNIPYPPLPEQSRIAMVLSYFDDLIENKKRQNEILEKTAMAIFKNWFIDFEPFKNGEFVYNEELGKQIPKGWQIKAMKAIAEIIMGQSPPSKFYNEDSIGTPFIQGKGQFGRYIPDTTIFCSIAGKITRARDILVTVRAPVGELNLADKEYIIGRGVVSLRTTFWAFLYLYLRANNELLKSFERGTTYDAITREELENFPILIPPSPILQKFHSLVEPLFQKIILNQKQIMTLRKVRDTLLPLLVFGRLRVEEL